MAIVDQPVHGDKLKQAYIEGKKAGIGSVLSQQDRILEAEANRQAQNNAYINGAQDGSLAMAHRVSNELKQAGLGTQQQQQQQQQLDGVNDTEQPVDEDGAPQPTADDARKVASLIQAAQNGDKEAENLLAKLVQDPQGKHLVIEVAKHMDAMAQQNTANTDAQQDTQVSNTPRAGLPVS